MDTHHGQGRTGSNPPDLDHYLKDIDYPIDQRELLRTVRTRAAPDELVEAIERLPASTFSNVQDVKMHLEQP